MAVGDRQGRREVLRLFSYSLSPAAVPYMALILARRDQDAEAPAVACLDRMRGQAAAQDLLHEIYLGQRYGGQDAALRMLERHGELVAAPVLHALLSSPDLAQRAAGANHLVRVLDKQSIAQRRALMAQGAIPLDDLQALARSPMQDQLRNALHLLGLPGPFMQLR